MIVRYDAEVLPTWSPVLCLISKINALKQISCHSRHSYSIISPLANLQRVSGLFKLYHASKLGDVYVAYMVRMHGIRRIVLNISPSKSRSNRKYTAFFPELLHRAYRVLSFLHYRMFCF